MYYYYCTWRCSSVPARLATGQRAKSPRLGAPGLTEVQERLDAAAIFPEEIPSLSVCLSVCLAVCLSVSFSLCLSPFLSVFCRSAGACAGFFHGGGGGGIGWGDGGGGGGGLGLGVGGSTIWDQNLL